MKVLLVIPPFTQLNTPYPATTSLIAFLRQVNIDAYQFDLGIEVINKIFSRHTFSRIFELSTRNELSEKSRNIYESKEFYLNHIDAVIGFMKGKNQTLSNRFCQLDFWPDTIRKPLDEDIEWAFGVSGNTDKSLYLSTLFLKDLCDYIKENIDENFELIKYAESLCLRLPTFDLLDKKLREPYTFIDEMIIDIFSDKIVESKPDVVGFTVPFPGNLLSTLRCCEWLKHSHPEIKTIIGGGYVNTELRQLTDSRIFNYTDYITFDDGELPLLRILQGEPLIRTMSKSAAGTLIVHQMDSTENIPFNELPTPSFDGLDMGRYINMMELTNPMHALWSNGKWNKIQLVKGCYWAKCTFCDCSLPYISHYEALDTKRIVDKMEKIIQQTGESGFHFVDEAAPPNILKQLAEEIINRKLVVSYWTNVRFDKSFTHETCQLLAKSGCIALSGGLEVASQRILKLINKGITVDSARDTLRNISQSGIMTHAYLMYGFPSQTEGETYESLEVVKNLFAQGYLHSAFWHRYAMTIHSPSGQYPESVGALRIDKNLNEFANNEIPFTTSPNPDWEKLGRGLYLATYNYMNGVGFDLKIKNWFKN